MNRLSQVFLCCIAFFETYVESLSASFPEIDAARRHAAETLALGTNASDHYVMLLQNTSSVQTLPGVALIDTTAYDPSVVLGYCALVVLPPVLVVWCAMVLIGFGAHASVNDGFAYKDVSSASADASQAPLMPVFAATASGGLSVQRERGVLPVARSNPSREAQPVVVESPFMGVPFGGRLCPELTVPPASTGSHMPSEATFFMEGAELTPYAQEDKAHLCRDSVGRELLLHIVISETGRDKGILLETALEHSVAYLHTGPAVKQSGALPVHEQRFVKICRASMGGGPTAPAFAVVMASEQDGMRSDQHFVMWGCTQTGEPGPVILQIYRVGTSQFNIMDAQRALVATLDDRRGSGYRALRVAQDTDVALVVCAITAAIKLS